MVRASERLYFQYKPDAAALEQLLAWQRTASRHNPQARQIRSNRLHVTVLHFGILADVYRELQDQVPHLKWQTYADAVQTLIAESFAVLPPKITVQPSGYELFGPKSQVLALRVRVDDTLSQAHEKIVELLKSCLVACGVNYPVPFMQGSPNFQFARQLEPHISLLRAARFKPTESIDPMPLYFHVLPIRYTA